MSRAYVITEKTGRGVVDTFDVLKVVSNKRKAIEACEKSVGEDGLWEHQEKHKGKMLDVNRKRAVSYQMFYVNEGKADAPV